MGGFTGPALNTINGVGIDLTTARVSSAGGFTGPALNTINGVGVDPLTARVSATGGFTGPTTGSTINGLTISNGTCTGVDFVATSDRRLKSDISTISNALVTVKGMRGVYFTRKGETERSVGVIAQEVEGVLPEVVHTGGDGIKSVSYGNVVGLLIEAVKELAEKMKV